MIREVNIKGYKSLKDVRIRLGSLNILAGANASGKSSLIQLMLLLRQSMGSDGRINNLALSGELFEAGSAGDVFHPESGRRIDISFKTDLRSHKLAFHKLRESGDMEARALERVARSGVTGPVELAASEERFFYLNAERLGPRVTYPLPAKESLAGPLGSRGEFTAAYLARSFISEAKVSAHWRSLPKKLARSNLDPYFKESVATSSFFRNCQYFLGWIIPGAAFQALEQSNADIARVSFLRDVEGPAKYIRSTHVGFGLSYALPVIVAGLALREDGILIVENPEAHLHPLSQSRMGFFLAICALSGRQVVIETHSDHVINGIRLAIRYNAVSPELIKFFFFKKISYGGYSSISEIHASERGSLDSWPNGFFDQLYKDLSRL